MAGENGAIPWDLEPIGALVEYRKGFAFKSAEYETVGHPIVRVSNLTDRSIDMRDCSYISPSKVGEYEAVKLRTGDVVIATVGSGPQNPASLVGRAIRVPPDANDALLNQNTVRLRSNGRVDQSYLFYSCRIPEFQRYLVAGSQGSANQASITLRQIFNFPIPLPTLAEQKAIAHILGTLDEKIELNRRMNETLEGIARAVFKSWFVDFDPVRAKMDGRQPEGMDVATAALFPDGFEEGELGKVPREWKIGKLGDMLSQRSERIDAGFETEAMPYVPIDCISPDCLALTTSKPGTEAQSSLIRFYKHDFLFGAMRPYFHKVCIAPFDGTTRTTAFVLFPKDAQDFSYSLLLLRDNSTIDYATRHSEGSTIPYAKWRNSLDDMPIIVPPPRLRSIFDQLLRPLLNKLSSTYYESASLSSLRDTLLPKLLSGEVRVGEAAEMVEAG